MTDCIRKFIDSDADGNRTGLYGATAYTAQSFINSTGTALISVGDDGKLVQNFSNANVDRAANFMQTLKNEGLASFRKVSWMLTSHLSRKAQRHFRAWANGLFQTMQN